MNKRLVLTSANTIQVQEQPIPEPPRYGMVIKIHYAGVCHSDIHFWRDRNIIDEKTVTHFTAHPNFNHPTVLGHEIAGEVYSIGAGGFTRDPDLKKGDNVLVFPWAGCAECCICKAGDNNLCPNAFGHTLGGGRDGGFQSYMTVKATDGVHKLPADMDMRVACIMTCSALTTYNGVSRIKQEVADGIRYRGFARVLLVGAGGLGLWATQWAQTILPQPTKVYVADVVEGKLKDALDLGAAGGILISRDGTAEDMAHLATQKAKGEFDGAVDLVGAASTFELLNRALRKGGRQVLIGMAGGTFPLPLTPTIRSARNIDACYTGSSGQMEEVIDMWVKGKVKCQPLTTFKPEQLEEVLNMLVEGKLNGRGVLDFSN